MFPLQYFLMREFPRLARLEFCELVVRGIEGNGTRVTGVCVGFSTCPARRLARLAQVPQLGISCELQAWVKTVYTYWCTVFLYIIQVSVCSLLCFVHCTVVRPSSGELLPVQAPSASGGPPRDARSPSPEWPVPREAAPSSRPLLLGAPS